MDGIWLSINKGVYMKMFLKLQKESTIEINIMAAFLAYVLMYIGFIVFIVPYVTQASFIHSIIYGGLFGLVIYGIYNATNAALFRGYSTWIAVMDTLWGMTLYAVNAGIVWIITHRII